MNKFIYITVLILGMFVCGGQVFAQKFRLRDGRILEGGYAQLSRVDERVGISDHIAKPISIIDDGLRRVYISKSQIVQPIPEQLTRLEKFPTGQSPNYEGKIYEIPGTYNNRTPFNKFGRRLLPVHYPGGVALVEQAIVELNPYYVRVTSLRADNQPVQWEMRIATNAIPREQITPILMHQIDTQKFDDRMRLVRFYFDGQLFDSADVELESILQDWKEDPHYQQRILAMSQSVRQEKYQQMIHELELRWDGGQYRFVRHYATALEQDPQLPERLLEQVRRMLRRFDTTDQHCQEIVATMRELYEQLPEADKSDKIPAIIADIEKELNFSTERRLTTFQLYASDPKLSAADKLAIGITGWYAGADATNSRLAVALMLPETEKLIVNYLRSGRDVVLRQRILEQLKDLETARPDLIAAILATMRPPLSDLPPEDPDFPGYYRLSVPNPFMVPGVSRTFGAAEIQYAVQLPPDYNPHQRYPMIVSLNGLLQTPEAQLDWWTGSWENGQRKRHATRHGYIVIAPDWNPQRKPNYDFSVFSHAAVLCSVRDAFRRFSVNTDKVFLSGHGDSGGTAAWDIAQAHPDLWAGAILFNAIAAAYIDTYWETVRHIPLYLVWGEMEGVGTRLKWEVNAKVLNQYLLAQTRPGDVTAVRYLGRGMESFLEEIPNVLEWMNLRQRNAVPSEFEVKTIRPGDSFFWWLEIPNLPGDRPERMVDPVDFQARSAVRPITVQSRLNRGTNNVTVTTTPPVANVQIFLSPDMIDFRTRATVRVNDKNFHPPNGIIEPDIAVLLEDVRTRADRLHPFWAMLDGR